MHWIKCYITSCWVKRLGSYIVKFKKSNSKWVMCWITVRSSCVEIYWQYTRLLLDAICHLLIHIYYQIVIFFNGLGAIEKLTQSFAISEFLNYMAPRKSTYACEKPRKPPGVNIHAVVILYNTGNMNNPTLLPEIMLTNHELMMN